MRSEIRAELHQGLRAEPAVRLPYTRRAFRMLPSLDRPRILDMGCGPEDPTLALARLSGGRVVGLDLDREQREIDLYLKYQRWYGSAFFVMRKTKA